MCKQQLSPSVEASGYLLSNFKSMSFDLDPKVHLGLEMAHCCHQKLGGGEGLGWGRGGAEIPKFTP